MSAASSQRQLIDRDWLSSMVEAYSGPLERFFRRRVDGRSEVDDLVQEVFYHLARRRGSPAIDESQAYLFQIATNVLRDRHRRARTRRKADHLSFDEHLHGYEHISTERVVAGRQQLEALKAGLFELPERTRTVFVLQRLEGLRYHEVAEHLGLSISTIEKHMMHAIRHLARIVE